jgi:hypothetical protein
MQSWEARVRAEKNHESNLINIAIVLNACNNILHFKKNGGGEDSFIYYA